jgi:hypothetical protein
LFYQACPLLFLDYSVKRLHFLFQCVILCIRIAEGRSQSSFVTKNQFNFKIKGSLTRDFRLQVFFMNQCPPGPQVFHRGRFEFFRKFANEYLSPVSLTPSINCSAVSTTPAINPCHGEITKKPKIFRRCQRHCRKLFTGVNDTADKLFGGVNDTDD